jgi:hypothetical protein
MVVKKTLTLKAAGSECVGRAEKLGDIINGLAAAGQNAQTVAELRAGMQYLNAPKLKSEYVEQLLLRHLRRLTKEAPSERIAQDVNEYLPWLRGALGLSPRSR